MLARSSSLLEVVSLLGFLVSTVFSDFSFGMRGRVLLSGFAKSRVSLLITVGGIIAAFTLLGRHPFPRVAARSVLGCF